MKIAVTGKGGVGKTTFAATLARLYADEGRKVLAADVDPDANLGLALGFDEETLDSIVPITKMRKLVEQRTGANEVNKFFKIFLSFVVLSYHSIYCLGLKNLSIIITYHNHQKYLCNM